jgi:hypothetical protein
LRFTVAGYEVFCLEPYAVTRKLCPVSLCVFVLLQCEQLAGFR